MKYLILALLAVPSSALAASPTLHVAPQQALYDTPVNIRLDGLEPGSMVTVHAATKDLEGGVWSSFATFIAPERGTLELASEAPVEGSYQGEDAMGLFWSMRPGGEFDGFFSWDTARPLPITLRLERAGELLDTLELTRFSIAPEVERLEVRDNGVVGTLFIPPGEGPHPAVMVLGGSEGGVPEGTAALLASRGYVTLALAYFGIEGLVDELVEIPLETFDAGLDYLQARPEVDAERVGLMGASKGGEAALIVASRRADIQVVVAYVPSHVVWQGISMAPFAPARSSWSWQGGALPFVPYTFTPELFEGLQPGDPVVLEPLYSTSLDAYEGEDAVIPVEEIQGGVLLISGTDDQLWPSTRMAEGVMARLEAHGFAHPAEHLRYEGAGHLILTPYLPTYGREEVLGLIMGGAPEAYAAADAASWEEVRRFLAASLGHREMP